jgi:glutamate synthase domain-containing protein 3
MSEGRGHVGGAGCSCPDRVVRKLDGTAHINAGGSERPMHYTALNCALRSVIGMGVRDVVLEDVVGQRYIAATAAEKGLRITIMGTPGNNLGAFLDGPTIEVFGNAQDMTGNTMNSGRIIVHGNAWDVTGLSARGGKLLIRGSSGYRVGIHMKEFGAARPAMVIGGTAKDYLGEYMAGGTIVVLGLNSARTGSPVGRNIGAGIHGGRIFVRGKVDNNQLGAGAVTAALTDADWEELAALVCDYEGAFAANVPDGRGDYVKVMPASSRPFSGHYDKTNI